MNTGNLLTRASRRALHFASIVTAMGLLAALLLLSAAPEQESYRTLDAKLRYVQDISVALSQTLDTAQRRDLDVANHAKACNISARQSKVRPPKQNCHATRIACCRALR